MCKIFEKNEIITFNQFVRQVFRSGCKYLILENTIYKVLTQKIVACNTTHDTDTYL